jgi:hypothetical protein
LSGSPPFVVVAADAAFADTEAVFSAAVSYLTRRYAAIQPMAIDLRGDRGAAMDALDRSAPVGWRRELARFFAEHAPVLLRPDPDLNARLRRARRDGLVLRVWSPLPRAAADAMLAALGVTRLAAVVTGEEDGDPRQAAIGRLRAEDVLLAADRAELDQALSRFERA